MFLTTTSKLHKCFTSSHLQDLNIITLLGDISVFRLLTCTIPFIIHILTVSVLWCLLDFSVCLCLLFCRSTLELMGELILLRPNEGGASLCCLNGVAELKSVHLYFPDTSLILGELAVLSITEKKGNEKRVEADLTSSETTWNACQSSFQNYICLFRDAEAL